MQMINPAKREEALKFLKEQAIVRGDFTLASGEKSNLYVDIRRAILQPIGRKLIGEVLFEAIRIHTNITQVGGLATGAIPLVCAVGQYYDGFYVRRETKPYGLAHAIEGAYRPEEPTAILEDVITTGESVFKVLKSLEEQDTQVEVIIALVDRSERQPDFPVKYEPIFRIEELNG